MGRNQRVEGCNSKTGSKERWGLVASASESCSHSGAGKTIRRRHTLTAEVVSSTRMSEPTVVAEETELAVTVEVGSWRPTRAAAVAEEREWADRGRRRRCTLCRPLGLSTPALSSTSPTRHGSEE
ncbi:hypothetical protein U1Q18_034386 [Sarracenia purpurea var. burkii]